jgi:hypothetical protein
MKIRITSITSNSDGTSIVEFLSQVGTGRGAWATWAAPPVVGREYDVEFDFSEVLGASVAEPQPKAGEPWVRFHDDVVELHVGVEAIDEDGVMFLRLNPECLIMVDCPALDFEVGDHLLLSLHPKALTLSPQGG